MLIHSAISAGTYLAAKRGLEELGPVELALARFAFAGGIYLLLVVRSRVRVERADWPQLLGLGFLGVCVNQLLFLTGMRLTTAGHGALLYALTPVFVLLIAWARRSERPGAGRVAGIGLAFAGTAVVLLSRGLLTAGGRSALLGDLIVLGAVVAWSFFAIGGKRMAERYGPTAASGWALLVGTALYLPFGLAFADLSSFQGLGAGTWAAVAYLVLVTNVAGWLIYASALARADASRVAVWSNLQPVLTALASWWLHGERLTPSFVAGGAMVLLGVWLTERA